MSSERSYRDSHTGPGYGKYYDNLLSGKYDSTVWVELVRPRLISLLEQERQSGQERYLDFACGSGRITEVATKIFDDVTGIDISADMIEAARPKTKNARFVIADITREPHVLEGTFDCITAFRFFLNAEESLRQEVLAKLAALTHPGSALIGNTHMNPWSIGGACSLLARKLLARNVNILSRAELERKLAAHGFRVEHWFGFRVMPTISGKPVLPLRMQTSIDRYLSTSAFSFFGSEQIFIARRA